MWRNEMLLHLITFIVGVNIGIFIAALMNAAKGN